MTSLCPCSKKISDYGAHNQRSHITLSVEVTVGTLTLEELALVAEEEASCQVYGLLKRPDEKWVTERAYDNPKFVEDLVRDVALRLRAIPASGASPSPARTSNPSTTIPRMRRSRASLGRPGPHAAGAGPKRAGDRPPL